MNLGEIALTEHEGDSAFSPTTVPASPFRIWDGTTPEGWEVTENDQWKFYFPTDAELPDEGWKIHISTVLDEADQALDIVSEICRQNSIGFKFTPTREMLAFKLSKNVSRSAAGKFCCLYPRDEEECGRIVNILLHALRHMHGPDILTDLRCGDAPVFVRWGAFTPMYCTDADGIRRLAIHGPDGELIADTRRPGLHIPDWVTWPAWTGPGRHRRANRSSHLPCTLTHALAHHAGGGVYAGQMHSTGATVLVKEGRPHAGIDRLHHDAVWRIRHEAEILRRLQGRASVPTFLEQVDGTSHAYLIREMIDGVTLMRERNRRLREQSTPAYEEWARTTLETIRRELEAVHDCGVVLNDVHENNILLADDRIIFFDLEAASCADSDDELAMAAIDYTPPPNIHGTTVDWYSFDIMTLSMFVRSKRGIRLGPARIRALAHQARRRHPSCADLIEAAAGRLLALTPVPPDAPGVTGRSTVEPTLDAIIAALDTHQERPHPSPAPVGTTSGTGAFSGDVGPAPALDACLRTLATVFSRLGLSPSHPDDALSHSPGLMTGTAGTGAIACLLAHTGDLPRHEAEAIIQEAARRLDRPEPPARPGMWEGATGQAVFWLLADLLSFIPGSRHRARSLLIQDAAQLATLVPPHAGGLDGRLGWLAVVAALEGLTELTVPTDLKESMRPAPSASTAGSSVRNGAIGSLLALSVLRLAGSPLPDVEQVALECLADDLVICTPSTIGVVDDPGLSLKGDSADGVTGALAALHLLRTALSLTTSFPNPTASVVTRH